MSKSPRASRRTVPHPPSGHEIKEIHLLIRQYESEIQQCGEKINELAAALDESRDADIKGDIEIMLKNALTQKESLELLIAQKKALVSHVTRLPSEILALVMMCHVHENDGSVWEILAVSRTWRYLGLETPRLWSRIWVVKRPSSAAWTMGRLPSSGLTDLIGGVRCTNEETWNIVLARSGVVSLDLIVDCNTSLMKPNFFTKIFLDSARRWRSLVCGICEDVPQWNIAAQSMGFPNLQSATFLQTCTGGPLINAILSAIGSTSTNICSLTVLSQSLTSNFSGLELLPRIKEFDFTPGYSPAEGVVWSHLTRLEVLVLRGWYHPLSSSGGHQLTSAKTLRVLAARSLPLETFAANLSRLRSLTHVYLDRPELAIAGPSDLHSIDLPNVTHFHLADVSYTPIQWFALPSLIVLELFGNTMSPSQANDEFDDIWNSETFGKAPSPAILHIEMRANDAYLLMALRSMDRLRELHLYYDATQSSSSKLMESLAVKPKKSVVARGAQAIKKWIPPTCPELETLFFIYKKLLKQDRADVNERLWRIRDARLGTAREMKELRVISRSESLYQTSNLAKKAMEQGVC